VEIDFSLSYTRALPEPAHPGRIRLRDCTGNISHAKRAPDHRCPSRGSVGARRSLRYPPLGLRAGRSPSPSYAERELLSSGNRATDGARVVPRPRAIGLGKDCADSGAIYRLQIALPDGTMIAGVSDDISWTTGKTDRLVVFSFRSVARFTEEEARDLLEREAIRLSDSSRASSRPAWTG